MQARLHIVFWFIAIAVFGLLLVLFRNMLSPFIVGMIIAYLLDPVVAALVKRNLSRTIATVLILSLFLLFTVILLALVGPPLFREAVQLIESTPEYLEQLSEYIRPYLEMAGQEVGERNLQEDIQQLLTDNAGNALSLSSSLFGGLLSGGRALANLVSFVLITPLVSFFMMKEWPAITKWIDGLVPRHSYDQIKKLITAIDRKIAGFIRGQLLVAASLGIIYAVALTIAGLEFGYLIGLMAGLLSIIPLFGSIVGLLVSVLVAWFQAGDIMFVMTIAAIFLVGQVVEGNVITPKLLGGSVGMHPLWILFSIMAGAALFGIVGMLLAVPIAATAGVLVNFGIEKYRNSAYFDS